MAPKLEIDPTELLSTLWPTSIPMSDYSKVAALFIRYCPQTQPAGAPPAPPALVRSPPAPAAARARPAPIAKAARPAGPVALNPQRKTFKPDTKIGKLLAAVAAGPTKKEDLVRNLDITPKTFPAYIQMLRNSGYDVQVTRTPAGEYTYSLPAGAPGRAG